MSKICVFVICLTFFFQGSSCEVPRTDYKVTDYKKYIIGKWASFHDVDGYREKPSSYFITFNEDGSLVVESFAEGKHVKKSKYEFKDEKTISTPEFPRHLVIIPLNENKATFAPEVSSGKAEVAVDLIYGSIFRRVK